MQNKGLILLTVVWIKLLRRGAAWSKTENKCLNSSSAAQLAVSKMVQQLLVFHLVLSDHVREPEWAGHWHSGKSLTQNPTCLCYHSIYHFTRDTACSSSRCVCVCVCSGGTLSLTESGQTGGTTRHTETERNRWSESANNGNVCVWQRERGRQWMR